jgi:hypothetical protein
MSNSKRIKYSGNVGKKFNPDGSAKGFPGNTIICHIPPNCETYQFLLRFRAILQQQPWIKNYALLPPSSYHMTVFEGVCDQVRKPSHWTTKLPLNASLEAVDNLLIEEWPKIQKPTGFTMQMDHHFVMNTIGIRLKPINPEMEQKIRGFRDILANHFGIKMPGHSIYHFHISFAYQIIKLNFKERLQSLRFMKKDLKEYQQQFGTLILNEPELTFFTDMTDFAPNRKEAQQNRQN